MNKSLILVVLCILTFQTNAQNRFALGADVGWLTEMEAVRRRFFNAQGVEKELMQLLKEDIGMNAIRLRVWVNPANGWNGINDVLVKSKRAHALGMDLMINFHYSDSWADPGKQNKPAAWVNMNFEQLRQAVYNHTYEVLDTLRNHGIIPKWVQVGNETGNGMLWPDGQANLNMRNYALLNNAGYDAVKAISEDIQVIVHLQEGHKNSLFRWIFDGLRNNGGKWDIIGMSVYPNWYTPVNDWRGANRDCLANMNDMVARYNKDVMIVECGMSWDSANESFAFLTDLIAKTKSVTGGRGKGVFYWEPQAYGNWQGYTLGAFNNNGRPTIALNAFRNAAILLSSTTSPSSNDNSFNFKWDINSKELLFPFEIDELNIYTINGILVDSVSAVKSYHFAHTTPGVYLLEARHQGGRDVIRFSR